MRIVRFVTRGRTKYGIVEGETVRELKGSPMGQTGKSKGALKSDGPVHPLSEVKLLAPCTPSKMVCLGLNYRSHAQEFNLTIPSLPLIFLKPSTSAIGPREDIVLPRGWKRVDYEAELGVVIGREAKDVPEQRAMEYVFGYTCFNDVSERIAQITDGQWTRAKGYDTFAPIGPWIETELDATDLKVETYVNGEVRQSGRTSELIFNIPQLISFISSVMTLLPGDIIATGTPAGIGPINPGDSVEIRIEGIGSLKNGVVEQPA